MTELHVPHERGNIVLDGDMDDPGWLKKSARTSAFVGADGVTAARPYSEARLVWGDGFLYVALYAADEDIRAKQEGLDAPVWLDDSFHLVFSDGAVERSFDVSATAVLADGERKVGVTAAGGARPFDYRWSSGAHLSREIDGTLNKPDDEDEEWGIEMAIPFEALGMKGEKGEKILFSAHRCDTPHSGVRSCGSWGEAAAHGLLTLD